MHNFFSSNVANSCTQSSPREAGTHLSQPCLLLQSRLKSWSSLLSLSPAVPSSEQNSSEDQGVLEPIGQATFHLSHQIAWAEGRIYRTPAMCLALLYVNVTQPVHFFFIIALTGSHFKHFFSSHSTPSSSLRTRDGLYVCSNTV